MRICEHDIGIVCIGFCWVRTAWPGRMVACDFVRNADMEAVHAPAGRSLSVCIHHLLSLAPPLPSLYSAFACLYAVGESTSVQSSGPFFLLPYSVCWRLSHSSPLDTSSGTCPSSDIAHPKI